MEDKTNIAELLKDAPEGTKVWSRTYGEAIFKGIAGSSGCLSFETIDKGWFYTDGYGRFSKNGECVILPCKGGSWENFKAPWKQKRFKPFEEVLVNSHTAVWTAKLFSHKEGDKYVTTDESMYDGDDIIPYIGNWDKLGKDLNT